jgi:hypothetical protein
VEDGATEGYEGAVGREELVKEVCGCARVVSVETSSYGRLGERRCCMLVRSGGGFDGGRLGMG